MAQTWAVKQTNYVQRLSLATVQFLALADEITGLCTEFTDNTYGSGGANALTDAAVQSYLPAATALLIQQAEGALAGTGAVLATIATNRGYLEFLRP